MELLETMEQRHSVRSYSDRKIEGPVEESLLQMIDTCNQESGLHIQLVLNEPRAFSGFMAHYGKFSGVKNYIAMIGRKSAGLEEKCGYYGEKLVLKAQQLGLNSCWVAMTYSKVKSAYKLNDGEKLCIIIAIGYGETQGVAHKSKKVEDVCNVMGTLPDWFKKGIEAALLAPTAVNQQKFMFSLDGNTVSAKPGMGFYSKVDLGIVKYHFEVGAGVNHFKWMI